MNPIIRTLWPELEWIQDAELREKTAKVWEYALERSVLTAEDLHTIPFTLLAEKACSFMAHKRSVVHVVRVARGAARGDSLELSDGAAARRPESVPQIDQGFVLPAVTGRPDAARLRSVGANRPPTARR